MAIYGAGYFLQNIYSEDELDKNRTCARVAQVKMKAIGLYLEKLNTITWMQFCLLAILIVDPEKPDKDRSYVIASFLINLRRLMDAGVRYLKLLSQDFDQYKMTRLFQN